MADHHQVGDACLVADLVGDDAHHQLGVGGHVAILTALGKGFEQDAPALLERLAHLGREVEVGLEAERARDVV